MRYEFFNFESLRDHPSMGPMYRRFGGRPGWTWKLAIAAALLVIVVPIVLLLLAAAVTFFVVLLIGSAIASVSDFLKSTFGGVRPHEGGGRRNVRVIRRDEM